MLSQSIQRWVAATIALILPQFPVVLCLALRGAEAWKLFYEMGRLTTVGIMVWMWTAAFTAAAVVTIFHLDDIRNLRRWEFTVEAANTVTSLFLAWDCSAEATGTLHALPLAYRFGAFAVVFLMIQFTVTFIARRARAIARRLGRNTPPQPPVLPNNMMPSH